MPRPQSIPRSILDLSPIIEGGTAGQALRNSIDLAQHAERLEYRRFWLAEHHNMPAIASAATAVVIGAVAAATERIRVGSGGVMLPNHPPLVIAEQFGTLESLYPGRIDLGLGRAPGSDRETAHALRRNLGASADTFPQDVLELQSYLGEPSPDQRIRAFPGTGTNVPVWLLGSSLFSATLAATLGLPFAFASHFAPDLLHRALRLYRSEFKPSAALAAPYAMVAANVFAAETDEEAQLLFTSVQQQFLNLRRGTPTPLQPPNEHLAGTLSQIERYGVEEALRYSLIGSRDRLRKQLDALLEETQPDEVIFTAQIYDHAARLRSFEILAGVFDEAVA